MKNKQVSREQAAEYCRAWQQQGQKVGFTSGAFDILHAGHVSYLQKARESCDRLIVALNSDKSVRKLKGEKRPICTEVERVEVLASLACVDAIFLFDDENNNTNISEIKPDLYIKAGDYSEDTLGSAPIVKQHGGEILIIPFVKGLSTSTIIERICERYADSAQASYLQQARPEMAPAAFLDRDGTINKHVEYLHEPEKFELLPGALEGLKALQEAGLRIVIVTNQPGIGLGYFSKEDFYRVNKEMFRQVSAHGIHIDKVYFSPYSQSDNSPCRKPETGMIDRAVEELNVDLEASFVIGDMTSDIELAKRAGCRSILVKTGSAGEDGKYQVKADFEAEDLAAAAEIAVRELGEYIPKPTKTAVAVASGEVSLEGLGEFAGKIGHDFNNILGTVRGCVDLIESRVKKLGLEQNPFERQLKILDTAVERGVQFTTRLRGFVRPEPLAYSEVDLEQCARSVVETLHRSEQLPADTIINVIQNSKVEIAEFMVAQMILGICLNSLEAMDQLSDQVLMLHIDRVECDKQELPDNIDHTRFARLSIIDHGSGMKEKAIKNLFAPFFSTKPKGVGKGFGLGLSMAKALMDKHGGFIQVQTEKQVGTAVHLFFPLPTRVS